MQKSGKRKIIGIGSMFLTLAIIFIAIYTYATQEIKIEVSQMPNVDIILTKSQTEANLGSFEEDLKSELVNQGVMSQAEIDSGKVKISAVDTQVIETQETFEWKRSVSSNIGSVSFTENGKNVTMAGNSRNAGKNAIWITPEGNQEQEFNFSYGIDFGDSFNAAGMLLRVKELGGNVLEGYMLSFNNSSFKTWSGNANAALWYFKYDGNNGTAFRNGTDLTLISALNISKSGNLNVKANDTSITITGGGLSSSYVYNIPQGKDYGSGYGFFSDHYSHGCDSIGYFQLTGINLKTETVKKFTEVLQAPDWRDGSLRILVNVEDGQNSQFANRDELTSIIAKLMNGDVYYLGWGTEENRTQIEEVIAKNDGKGVFVPNNSQAAVQATVEYIKSVIKGNKTNTIIVAEPVNVKITSPITGVVDTPTEAYPNGVWKVEHDYNYYENAQGQYEFDGMYSNDLINKFNNVGRYDVYCEDRLVTQIYAHRRPVASFNMNKVNQEITLNSTSQDLDIQKNAQDYEEQKNNKGIKSEKWEYKKINEENASWIEIPTGQIGETVTATLDSSTEYMVRLTITDYQGVEASAIKYVTVGETVQKPIASYKVVNKTISIYDKLDVIDESYDPSGAALTYEWKVSKTDKNGVKTDVYTGNTPLLDYSLNANSKYGVGTYKMILTVSKTVSGKVVKSDEFSQIIEVTDDTTAPIITITPPTAKTQNTDIDIKMELKDEESGLKSFKYALTESIQTPEDSEWKSVSLSETKIHSEDIKITRDMADKYLYLHVIATNNAGVDTQERIAGTYYIEPTYQVVVQVVDKETGSVVEGTEYSVIGEYADGSTIDIAKGVTTDRNGKITIPKARLKDVAKLKIENTGAAAGYDISEYKNVKIDTSTFSIVVDKTESSNDIETEVAPNGQSLKVKVKVEKSKFNLKITNKDLASGTLLSGTEFVLKQNGTEIAKGTTENGETILSATIGGLNITKEYILEQTKISDNYTNIGTTILNITFDPSGEISKITQKIFAVNNAVEIPDSTKAEIIVKNQRIDKTQFSVNINVKDGATNKEIVGTKYKVMVQGQGNLNYTTGASISDQSGNIKIDGLYGKGILKLTFIHEEAAPGYAKELTDRYITIQRNEDESISYNNASMSGVFDKAENKTVYVKLTNNKKSTSNAIKVRVLSKENSSIGIEGVGLKVYKLLDNSLIGEGTTDEKGLFEINDVKTDGKGDVLYKVVPNNNEIVKNSPIFVITYNENKKITQASQITANEDTNVYYTEDDDQDMFKYTANVDINGESKPIIGNNKLTLTQKSSIDGSILEGVQYKVKVIGNTMSTNVLETDENGKLETVLPNDKNIRIEMTQIKTQDGYKLDSRVKTINLVRNNQGVFTIMGLSNIDNNKISVGSDGNINLEQLSYSNKNSSIIFKIAKTDSDDKLSLGGVKFKITENTTGYSEELITDAKGYVAFGKDFIATEGKSYTFNIEETETISPYKLPETPIKVEVRFTKEGEIITYNGATYLQGVELISSKAASYNSDNNEVTISLKIKNYADTETMVGTLYNLDIKKVDKNEKEVDGSKYDIEIRPYATNSITSTDTLITNKIEIANLAIKQDKTTILLKEKTAGIGQGLDTKIKVVTLKLDNNGELTYDTETTSSDVKVNVKQIVENGTTKKIVEITIIAEEPKEEEQPENPTPPIDPDEPTDPDEPGDVDKPAEERPEDATVGFKLHNKSYGDWKKTYSQQYTYMYTYKCNSSWCFKPHYASAIAYKTVSYNLAGAQKLERIFKDISEAKQYGFEYISGANITLETRLLKDNVVSNEIYETTKAKKNTVINDTNGTDSIYLYKDYKNKTVEITVKENVPPVNYQRNTTDAKFIVKFDGNGKVQSGYISQGLDGEEFAVGGISAEGIVSDIKYLISEELSGKKQYSTGDIEGYNSIGQDTIYLGLLNKSLRNPLELTVNLKDADTGDGLNGKVSAIITERLEDNTYVTVGNELIDIKDGKAVITLNSTYANRTLRFMLVQTDAGTKNGYIYINPTTEHTQFEVTLGDDANIKDINLVHIPSNVEFNGADKTQIGYTMYNNIKYNFALNLNKIDENGNPLSGVRVRTTSSVVYDKTMGYSKEVFTYGSALTDEKGNAKLKIVLPESGEYKYQNATVDVKLDEYYVPDNYRANQGLKLRILFNEAGIVKDTQILEGEDLLKVLSINNVLEFDIEKSSVDVAMKNSQITDKPVIEITNMDSEDNTVKLSGTKYKITSWDEEEYATNNLSIKEIRPTQETNESGKTRADFQKAHALKTIIYRIQEVNPANSYEANDDTLIKIKYDKEGKIAENPEILTEEYIYVPNKSDVRTVKIEGNPIGSTLLKLNIINELKPKFTININRNDTIEGPQNDKVFKAVSRIKNEDGTYENINEERISYKTVDGKTNIGFKISNPNKTVSYTIYEETGNTYTQRGIIEVTFDQYGNVTNTIVTGKYIKGGTFTQNSSAINTTITSEKFKMGIKVESTQDLPYSLAGYTFEITNNKGEKSNVNTKTNNVGKVIEIVGEVYKGETVNYEIVGRNSANDYEDVQTINLEVVFDDDGNITSCTPMSEEGIFDLITTTKDTNTGEHMQLKMYVQPSIRNTVNISVTDENDNSQMVTDTSYKISVKKEDEQQLDMNLSSGENGIDIGSYKNYKNKTVVYTMKQVTVNEKYMINDKPIQLSVTYNDVGIITDARLLSSDGYVKIDTSATVGTKDIVLETNNRRKTVMQVYNENNQLDTDKLAGAKFSIIETGKSNIYGDTKITDAEGKAELYVGPYYKSERKIYKITNNTSAFGFDKVADTEFTLVYDSNGKVIGYDIPVQAQGYVSIEIPGIFSPLYGKTDVKITIKSTPLFTLGVNSIDKVTQNKLTGGKYEIKQVGNSNNIGTVITQMNKTAHASIGKTEPGKTIEYQIVEKEAPLGYKFKDKDKVIGSIKVFYDANGYIIKNSTTLLSGQNYITIVEPSDKPETFDIDIKIDYEEIEELKIVVENESITDNTVKISSRFDAQLTTGVSANTTTDAVTGLGSLEFGKITATNSTQSLIISQSDIQGSYLAIATIKMNITFDENGKIKRVSPQSSNSYATEGISYKIDQIGSYTIKITVKNNPVTSIKLKNVSDGTNNIKLNSTYELSGRGISPTMNLTTEDGEATAILTSIPKNTTVDYTLKQTSIDKGYSLNRNITLRVVYDNNGKITSATIENNTGIADSVNVKIIKRNEYEVELEIKNRQIFEIYLEAQDRFNENIKLSGINVYIKDSRQGGQAINLTTDKTGTVNAKLGSTVADSSLTYEVKLLNSPSGYNNTEKVEGYIRISFGSDGSIVDCTSSNPLIEVKYGNGLAIEMNVKYTPTVKMEISRRNLTNNTPLSGRTLTINSPAIKNTLNLTTNSNGKVNIDGGNISGSNTVTYTISENKMTGASDIESLPTVTIAVTYDDLGLISYIGVSDTTYMTATGVGTRNISVEIGSNKKASISLINSDYHNNTIKLSGNYEITSEKGEKVSTITSSGTIGNVVDLGKVYSGEKVKYIIHQKTAQGGYEVIDDQSFFVTYNLDGTIGKVEAEDEDRLLVNQINQSSSPTQANIVLELRSKSTLEIKIKVHDKQYNEGVYGLGFKVKNEESGLETTVDNITDKNGTLTIPVVPTYENKHVTYTITQTKTYGGYKNIDEFKVIVEYGNLGAIVENGTYVINNNKAKVTPKYSEDLYSKTKQKGIQIEVEAETKMGIGIEKTDVKGNVISGVEYIITAKDTSDDSSNSWRETTDNNGKILLYTGELPKDKTIEYTISELQAPAGYRKVEDTIIKVSYNSEGRIISYNEVQKSNNVTLEMATNNLAKMSNTNESVHMKLKIQNDNRVSFKIVNKDAGFQTPIKDSSYALSVQTSSGTQSSQTVMTDINGEAKIENVEGTGKIIFYFNQLSVPDKYVLNSQNSGYITIDKSSTEYNIKYEDGTDNLNYTIDNEIGLVTIYLENSNNLKMNIIDVNAENYNTVTGGTHAIKAQYGNTSETVNDIINKTDNIITYNNGNPYTTVDGLAQIDLGSTYNLADKKVVYTISTITMPEGNYNDIGDAYVVVEFDSKGIVKKVNGVSSNIMSAIETDDLTISTILGFGNNDRYKVKVIKEAEGEQAERINGAKFNIAIDVNGKNAETHNDKITSTNVVNGVTIENGVIDIRSLKYEGKIKITLNETEAPSGYENTLQGQIEVEFDASLDKSDPNNVKLKAENLVVNGNNTTVEINEATKEVIITITNKPVLNLNLTKVDEYGNSLVGIKFNLKVQQKNNFKNVTDYGTLTVQEDGTIKTAINRTYVNETILITLTEEKVENYQALPPITIEVDIDSNGQIIQDSVKLISGLDNAQITESTQSSINMKIVNKLEEFARVYGIKIVKTDANDANIKLSNVLFQVKVTPDVGVVIYKAVLTDQNGEIKLDGLTGSGNINIELKEINPPEGYDLGIADGYYTYKVQKVNQTLQKVSSNNRDDLWNIDNNNNIVNIEVQNNNKSLGLAINKTDKMNGLSIEGTSFKLTNDETLEEYTAITDNKGLANFILPKGSNATYSYTLVESNASSGYQLDTTPRTITIKCDGSGNISEITKDESLELLDKNSDYAKLEFKNEQIDIGVEPYGIQIINVDKDNNTLVIPNSEFNIKINQTIGASKLDTTEETDANGIIDLKNVNGAGDIEITVNNTKAAKGYTINSNNNSVKLTRDIATGRIIIKEANNVDAIYDEENSNIKIYVESSKEKNKYSVTLNMIDKNTGELIKNSNAKLKVNINGENIESLVNEEGKLILQGLDIPEISKFEISLVHTKEADGYKKITENQTITANVTTVYDEKALYNIQIKEGSSIQIASSNDNEISLNVLNEKIETSEDELYLTSDIYRVTDNYVERISNSTKLKDYLANMKSNGEMKVYDKDGNLLTDESIVGTGTKIVATKENEKIEKVLSVVGDVTGDGIIKALDISKVKRHIIGIEELDGAYFLAADINDDGSVKALDISKLKQAVIGKIQL